jgi:hypothetical protein
MSYSDVLLGHLSENASGSVNASWNAPIVGISVSAKSWQENLFKLCILSR